MKTVLWEFVEKLKKAEAKHYEEMRCSNCLNTFKYDNREYERKCPDCWEVYCSDD